jgi:hypothetical protein
MGILLKGRNKLFSVRFYWLHHRYCWYSACDICFKLEGVLLYVQIHQMWTVLLSLSEIPLLMESCCSGIRMQNGDCLLNIHFAADWSKLRFKDNISIFDFFYVKSFNVCLRINRTSSWLLSFSVKLRVPLSQCNVWLHMYIFSHFL